MLMNEEEPTFPDYPLDYDQDNTEDEKWPLAVRIILVLGAGLILWALIAGLAHLLPIF